MLFRADEGVEGAVSASQAGRRFDSPNQESEGVAGRLLEGPPLREARSDRRAQGAPRTVSVGSREPRPAPESLDPRPDQNTAAHVKRP